MDLALLANNGFIVSTVVIVVVAGLVGLIIRRGVRVDRSTSIQLGGSKCEKCVETKVLVKKESLVKNGSMEIPRSTGVDFCKTDCEKSEQGAYQEIDKDLVDECFLCGVQKFENEEILFLFLNKSGELKTFKRLGRGDMVNKLGKVVSALKSFKFSSEAQFVLQIKFVDKTDKCLADYIISFHELKCISTMDLEHSRLRKLYFSLEKPSYQRKKLATEDYNFSDTIFDFISGIENLHGLICEYTNTIAINGKNELYKRTGCKTSEEVKAKYTFEKFDKHEAFTYIFFP